MARPCKKGMDYFPHDVDASSDEKIEAIRALHGNDGYAFYFILLERIYRTAAGELDISNTAKKAAVISKIGVGPDKFNAMLKDAFEIELFDERAFKEKHCITSLGIKKRVDEVEKLREKWRRKKEVFSGENKGDNSLENLEETGERKEKEIKEKEILYTPEFEKFYSLYPNRFNKERTFKNWEALLKKGVTADQIMTATNNYLNYIETSRIDKQYITRSTNFLGRKGDYLGYLETSGSNDSIDWRWRR